jgi:hypothetical protein
VSEEHDARSAQVVLRIGERAERVGRGPFIGRRAVDAVVAAILGEQDINTGAFGQLPSPGNEPGREVGVSVICDDNGSGFRSGLRVRRAT